MAQGEAGGLALLKRKESAAHDFSRDAVEQRVIMVEPGSTVWRTGGDRVLLSPA